MKSARGSERLQQFFVQFLRENIKIRFIAPGIFLGRASTLRSKYWAFSLSLGHILQILIPNAYLKNIVTVKTKCKALRKVPRTDTFDACTF